MRNHSDIVATLGVRVFKARNSAASMGTSWSASWQTPVSLAQRLPPALCALPPSTSMHPPSIERFPYEVWLRIADSLLEAMSDAATQQERMAYLGFNIASSPRSDHPSHCFGCRSSHTMDCCCFYSSTEGVQEHRRTRPGGGHIPTTAF